MRTITKEGKEQKAKKGRMNERMLDPCLELFTSLREQPGGRRPVHTSLYVLCLTCAAGFNLQHHTVARTGATGAKSGTAQRRRESKSGQEHSSETVETG
jgi:hypothetical protein